MNLQILGRTPQTGDQPCRKAPTYTGQHKQNKRVRFEVLTAVVMKTAIFWDTAPYSPYMKRRFGGTYHLHLQILKSDEQETSYNRWLDTSETSVHIRTTLLYISEDGNFQYASSGILTQDPSVRVGKYISCLRLRGHCDRLGLDLSCDKYYRKILSCA
jgi:hypothetical protein